jgi:hypothetical protein
MLVTYRRELQIDLPPIEAVMNDLDRQVSDIEALVESRLSAGRASKWFGRKDR